MRQSSKAWRLRVLGLVSWGLLAIVAGSATTSAWAQIKILPPPEGDNVADILNRGRDFESQLRWGEAINLYEEALKDHPNDRELFGRHDLAKIHYDLGRRYHDSSFLKALATLPTRDAMSLYGEVLLKIQTHYVAEPDWRALVERGIQDLRVATQEEGFAKQNFARQPSASELQVAMNRVAGLMQGRAIRSRQDAEAVVSAAAQSVQQSLRVPMAATIFEFTSAAAGALDEYSSYLTGDQLNDVYSQIEGNFVGLGIELKAVDGALQIVKTISGSPAEKAGIRGGDRIVAVDGRATTEMNTDQAADLLQGPEGSVCRVSVVSPGAAPRQLSVRRAHVDVPSVDDVKIIDREYGVGYLKLTCFQKTTSRDLDTALWTLQKDGMRSLVIDLRGNPGGLLTSSVEVADKFINDGVIVSTRGRSKAEDFNYTARPVGTWRVPLVLLIDGDSASASEIFAGAIRDHRRGTLVGQRSYGKGSVQGIFPLNVAGAGIRLTTAKFYSPNGQAISHVGVSPDIKVQKVAKPVADDLGAVAARPVGADARDSTLDAGLQAARRQIAKR